MSDAVEASVLEITKEAAPEEAASEEAAPKKVASKTPKKAAPKESPPPPERKEADAEIPLSEINVIVGDNPRKDFDREELKNLMNSVQTDGLLQPLIVRKDPEDGYIYLVAGERRLRALKLLKAKTARVCWFCGTATEAMVARVQENMQRADLNELEEGEAFKSLLGQKTTIKGVGKAPDKEVPFTAKMLSEKFGKTQGHISQRLKLLELPSEVQTEMRKGGFTFTQARTLLEIEGTAKQLSVFRQLMKGGTIQTKDVKAAAEQTRAAASTKKPRGKAANIANAEDAAGKPNLARQGLDTALANLRSAKVTPMKVTALKDSLATVYERQSRAKSSDKQNYWKGVAEGLEIASGLKTL